MTPEANDDPSISKNLEDNEGRWAEKIDATEPKQEGD